MKEKGCARERKVEEKRECMGKKRYEELKGRKRKEMGRKKVTKK
jgi:hypothetical protein